MEEHVQKTMCSICKEHPYEGLHLNDPVPHAHTSPKSSMTVSQRFSLTRLRVKKVVTYSQGKQGV